MANDLVPYNPPPGNGVAPTPPNGTNGHGSSKPSGPYVKSPVGAHVMPDPEHWDLPPVDSRHSYTGSYRSAQRDYQEAQDADQHGDHKHARGRRQDAEENLQQTWDWGDLRTWLIIAMMFFFGILLATTAYLLPHGRDAETPPIYVH